MAVADEFDIALTDFMDATFCVGDKRFAAQVVQSRNSPSDSAFAWLDDNRIANLFRRMLNLDRCGVPTLHLHRVLR